MAFYTRKGEVRPYPLYLRIKTKVGMENYLNSLKVDELKSKIARKGAINALAAGETERLTNEAGILPLNLIVDGFSGLAK